MPSVMVEPTRDVPMPYAIEDEPVPTVLEALAVAGNTAELQAALGAPIELAPGAHRGLEQVLRTGDRAPLNQMPVALAAASFLREYGQSLAMDVATMRVAITNKLLEIANCGDTKHELRALELLGKHSDIGLFTERSEITINYKSPEDLEKAITDRVKRLLHADIIDVTPGHLDLDKTLGLAPADTLKDELEAALGTYVPDEPDPDADFTGKPTDDGPEVPFPTVDDEWEPPERDVAAEGDPDE